MMIEIWSAIFGSATYYQSILRGSYRGDRGSPREVGLRFWGLMRISYRTTTVLKVTNRRFHS